jgi:hypothetical protein
MVLLDLSRVCTHLTIIKCSFNSDIVHICVSDSRHLRFLDRGDTALWMQNENRDVGLVSKTIDGSAT